MFTTTVAIAFVATLLTAGQATAQSVPAPQLPFNVIDVQHHVDGHVIIPLRVPAGVSIDSTRLSVQIDGVLMPSTIAGDDPQSAGSVVIAIDASEAMRGAPLIAARQAASLLSKELNASTQVGVVTLGAAAALAAPLSTDRSAVNTAISQIAPGGGAALYDGIRVASALLDAAPKPRSIVVLSNATYRKGEEIGGISQVTRSQSIALAREANARVYTFGMGSDPDRDYLTELSGITGGNYEPVGELVSLGNVLTNLGQRLGAKYTIDVPVPPLATKSHTVTVRYQIGKTTASLARPFEVTNAGFMTATIAAAPSSSDTMILSIESPAPPGSVTWSATAGNVRIVLDPATRQGQLSAWDLPPGQTSIHVNASVDAQTIADQTISTTIPVLAPRLDVTTSNGQLRAIGLAQAERTHVVVVAGDRVLDTSTSNTLELKHPTTNVTVRLLIPDDSVVASVDVSAPPHGSALSALQLLLILVGGIAALLGMIILRRLAGRRPARAPEIIRPQIGGDLSSSHDMFHERRSARFTLTTPEGESQSYLLGDEPITIGSARSCQVVVPDPALSPRFAQLSLSPDGRLRMFRLDHDAADSPWTLIDDGEAIPIGSHILRSTSS